MQCNNSPVVTAMVDPFVLADDGLFYRDPVIAPPIKSRVVDWYLCFDSPLRPTMVLRVAPADLSPARVWVSRLLREANLRGVVGPREAFRPRTFPPLWNRASPSVTFRITLTAPVPATHIIQHSGTLEDASVPGLYYDFGGAR